MNKIIATTIITTAMFGFVAGASAEATVNCGDGHAIWSMDNTHITSCVSAEAWKLAQSRIAAGLDQSNLIPVARGQKVLTTWGYVDTCPMWYPAGCVIEKKLFVSWAK